MSAFGRATIIIVVLLVPGCSVTHKYQGNTFPELSSPSFPVFTYVNQIPDDIKKIVPEGKGKTKISLNMTTSTNQKNVVMNRDRNIDWDITLTNDLFYINSTHKGSLTSPKGTVLFDYQVNGIYEKSGKELKFEVVEGSENGLSSDEMNGHKKNESVNIESIFSNIGESIKVGDVFKNTPNQNAKKLNAMANGKFQESTQEIVKGMGVYQNKRVIVTEILQDDNFQNSDVTGKIRGKGYKLYDAESFVKLAGKATYYMMLFTPKEGTVGLKIEEVEESYDVQLKSPIDPTTKTKVASKESTKSSWAESSEKIQALGVLLEKRLISKDDYEIKKNALLKNF